jgi:hypothetical protein
MPRRKFKYWTDVLLLVSALFTITGILLRQNGTLREIDLFFVVVITAAVIIRLFTIFLPRLRYKPTREELERKVFDDKN